MQLLSSLILALVGTSAAVVPVTSRRAFVPKKSVAVNKALSVRGGAGPLPVDTTAKAAALLCGLQGLVQLLAPEKNIEAYEAINTDKFSAFLNQLDGADLLAPAIASCGVLFHDVAPMKVSE